MNRKEGRAMLDKIKQLFKSKSSNPNAQAKNEQYITAAVLAGVALFAYGFYLYSTQSSHPKKVSKDEISFDGTFDKQFSKSSDEALIARQQSQIDALQERISFAEKKKPAVNLVKETDDTTKELVKALTAKLNKLEVENKKTNEKLQVALLKNNNVTLASLKSRAPSREEIEFRRKLKEKERYQKAGLETVTFHRKRHKKTERTPANYVWAGTFVSGIMLTGVMGDAGVNGSKNTGNVLIRLDENGTMPNGKRSRLKDCFVLGSSYGDLSGDSVVIHSETISCARGDLSFEQKIYGSVFDRDAMQDLRGTPILKTKPLLGYTAAAGLLAGVGDGLKNYGTAQSINTNGSLTTFSTSSIARSAAGGALTNPANKISDYIMKIADIYHPIVVARPGRRVTVLFVKGFWIDKAHQKYESWKSIDNKQARNDGLDESSVTPYADNTTNYRQLNQDKKQPVYRKAPSAISSNQSQNQAAMAFLRQKGINTNNLVTPVQ